MPRLSLIICSRNRDEALGRCLDSIRGDELLAVDGELVVVDNGSTDRTADVIAAFREKANFPVKTVHEPIPGLSNARNAGLLAASGELLAFTDDDCYLGENYFGSVIHAYAEPRFDYCGGRILLYDPSDAFYACNDKDTFELLAPHSFIPAGKIQGANMVIRRQVLDKIGPFDPMLGAGTPFRCEDVEYVARASLAGFTGAHVPEIVVYHHHGRKPGEAIEKMKRDNDYARGAYYAKFILRGRLDFARHWVRLTRKYSDEHDFATELKGALHYAAARLLPKGR